MEGDESNDATKFKLVISPLEHTFTFSIANSPAKVASLSAGSDVLSTPEPSPGPTPPSDLDLADPALVMRVTFNLSLIRSRLSTAWPGFGLVNTSASSSDRWS